MAEKIKSLAQEVWVFIRAVSQSYAKHRCSAWAASLAYYGFISIFPLLIFLVYLSTRLLVTEEVRQGVDLVLTQVLPAYQDQIGGVIDQTITARRSIGIIGIVGLIWSGSAVFSVLEIAMSRIWETDPRSFWRRRLLAAITVLVLVVAFVASFFITPLANWLASSFELLNQYTLRVLITVTISLLTLFSIFRVFPNAKVSRRAALVGALVGVTFIEIGKYGFATYLDSAFANYGAIYGSIAWIAAPGVWLFLVSSIFFFSAEVAAEYDRRFGVTETSV